jgi:hypothetical protein
MVRISQFLATDSAAAIAAGAETRGQTVTTIKTITKKAIR